ncbi:ABC transporter ATP-binding protein [Vandammella animalimorsus]|uniref:ABC transporter ATP-binding protein n=1 Tax=Vandammella animalimorsus TaxID=2029117 RepID=A0A2A2T510_9BURK|nr:ABC transporter ATP-binding protein [Vandammella animalimorsus]PAT35080.1 ABC transporter ATP-binding protein [Vandammella animalimorsus]PAX16640.1 ABC transporter ATP-binding protein [Vandammella animalimorsus]PAX19270.1 ABC transporter ATP-binding protein [Vandammella animalimorsus]
MKQAVAVMVPKIEFKSVAKCFPTRANPRPSYAVQHLNLQIAQGEVVSVIGPSGCGKSTLLNMGSGLYLPSEGEVLVEGRRVTGPVRQVAFMLQKDLLMPWRTIRQNVELGMEINGASRDKRQPVAEALLKKCHLAGFENHYPYQLSGGMRQRAALARTLAVQPDVLMLDEPFSALDAQTKMVLQQDLAATLWEEQKTALFITHDLIEAIALSDRILVMSERPGRIIEEIIVELPHRNNPMQRRRMPEVAPIQSRLMKLLRVGEETLH